MERSLSPTPVFVVGAPHSGLDLLAWSLAQHRNAVPILETRWILRLVKELEEIHQADSANGGKSHLVAKRLSREAFVATFGQAIGRLLVGGPESGDGQNQASTDEGKRYVHSKAPKWWVDSTPGYVAHIPTLLALFPNAKFVHVLRDVTSAVHALGALTSERLDDDTAYAIWLQNVRAGFEAEIAFGSETILRIRYIDLIQNPEKTLRQCLRFLGEEFNSSCLRVLSSIPQVTPEDGPNGKAAQPQDSQVRREAELLSKILTNGGELAFQPDPDMVERMLEAGRTSAVHRPAGGNDRSYGQMVRDVAHLTLPPNAKVLVISKGDESVLQFGEHKGEHFPQGEGGVYAGYHPGSSDEAISHLEMLCKRGAQYLVIPSFSFWWLDHYDAFRSHLERRCRLIAYQEDVCIIYALTSAAEKSRRRVTLADTGSTGTDARI